MSEMNKEVTSQQKLVFKLCMAMIFKEEIVFCLKLLRGNSFLSIRH